MAPALACSWTGVRGSPLGHRVAELLPRALLIRACRHRHLGLREVTRGSSRCCPSRRSAVESRPIPHPVERLSPTDGAWFLTFPLNPAHTDPGGAYTTRLDMRDPGEWMERAQ